VPFALVSVAAVEQSPCQLLDGEDVVASPRFVTRGLHAKAGHVAVEEEFLGQGELVVVASPAFGRPGEHVVDVSDISTG